MTYAIETLETELRLVEEVLKDWGPDYQDIKKRQEKKAAELKKAIEILNTKKQNG